MAIVKHCYLKAAQCSASRCRPNLYCACAQTAISELLIKFRHCQGILQPSFPIWYGYFWQSVDIYYVTLTFDLNRSAHCNVRLFAPYKYPYLLTYLLTYLDVSHAVLYIHWDNFDQVHTQSIYLFLIYNIFTANMLHQTVTLTTGPWHWTLYRLSCDQPLYQIRVKSHNAAEYSNLKLKIWGPSAIVHRVSKKNIHSYYWL